MNNKLLLVHSITLLYRESQLADQSENSAQMVREIINNIRGTEVHIGLGSDRDIVEALKSTTTTMCEMPLGHKYELTELLQRLKIDTMDEEVLYSALQDGMVPDLSENEIKRVCLSIRKSLKEYFHETKIMEVMTKRANLLKFNRNKITDMRRFVSETISELEPYQVDHTTIDPGIIDRINIRNTDQVVSVFREAAAKAEGTSMMRTGWQGINRMLGGGFGRGEFWIVGALEHNYKTGFTLSIADHIALYNKPYMLDETGTKKPMILRISFEDPLTNNLQFMYQALKQNETGEVIDLPKLENLSLEEQEELLGVMARYIDQRLSINGYHLEMMYVDPSKWTYRDIINTILEFEADGYEIHFMELDYLLKLPTTGCTPGPMGDDIRNMYERIMAFTKSRNITVLNPHQLSPKARELVRNGTVGLVKELPKKGMYDGCGKLGQVVDGEIFINIEEVNHQYYLTAQRGKCRRPGPITPYEDLYTVLLFSETCILDDINGPDMSRKKVGGGPVGSKEEKPFWDFG